MKVGGALCLVSFLVQADLIQLHAEEEIKTKGPAIVSRSKESSEEIKVDHPSFSQEEGNNPDLIIINANEKLSSGGGVPLLKPNAGESIAPFLPSDMPWWEQWWMTLCAWFSKP